MKNADGSAIIDFAGIASSKLVGLPPFQFCKFDLTSILVMAPIAIATMMEHIGDLSAISATVGENFIEDPGLHRTLVGDGLATSLSAFFGKMTQQPNQSAATGNPCFNPHCSIFPPVINPC